jgi:hypothetical protein
MLWFGIQHFARPVRSCRTGRFSNKGGLFWHWNAFPSVLSVDFGPQRLSFPLETRRAF